jgi:hypothetical protein
MRFEPEKPNHPLDNSDVTYKLACIRCDEPNPVVR